MIDAEARQTGDSVARGQLLEAYYTFAFRVAQNILWKHKTHYL